ncbi:hypothetical protein [Kribbella qitaiheensis]|nr:hypothetical protein [Kribbella qitaiheensis]
MSVEEYDRRPRRRFLLSRLGPAVDALEHLVGGWVLRCWPWPHWYGR